MGQNEEVEHPSVLQGRITGQKRDWPENCGSRTDRVMNLSSICTLDPLFIIIARIGKNIKKSHLCSHVISLF